MMSRVDHYALAATLSMGHREARLLRGPVRPMWAADGSHLWHRTRDADGVRHILVDVAARTQTPLFDHEALAAALAAAGAPLPAATLMLDRVRYDRGTGSVYFIAGGGNWRWTGAQLERLGDAPASAAIAPDGGAVVTLDGPNLVLHDGAVQPLTDDGEADWGWGDFTDFTSHVVYPQYGLPRTPSLIWSPDSSRFAVLRVDRRAIPQNHIVQSVLAGATRPTLYSYPFPTPQDPQGAPVALWFIGRDGRKVAAQIPGLECRSVTALALNEAWWAADGRRFFITDISRDSKALTIWQVDADTGAASIAWHEAGPGVMCVSPAISEPANFHALADGRLIAWSQRSGWGHLYLAAPGADPVAITSGDWLVRSLLFVDEAAGRIIFSASGREPGIDPYFCHAYSVAFDGSGLTLLTPDAAQHELFKALPGSDGAASVSPCGRWLVDSWSTVAQPPQSVLRDGRSGALVMPLQQADAGGSWPDIMPLPEPFHLPALDPAHGELWGMIYKPAGFDPDRRYKVIELIYGWPQTPVVAKGWIGSFHNCAAEQFAALGFVVVMLDGPGTPYRSHGFQLASHGRIEDCDSLADHVNALRWLAASRPWMDIGRVGIVGGSAGGFSVVRAMARFPELYQVGVSVCGAQNINGIVASWGDRYQGLYDPALYAATPNAGVADRITGDLLLIHGDMDDNVHVSHALQLVDALIKADRNVDLLIVPNAGHAVLALPYAQRRAFDFVVSRLLGEVPPRPEALRKAAA